MPVLGWLSGSLVASYISAFDHWIALVLLAFVGGRMVRSGLDPDEEGLATDPSRGGTLVMLAIATSIDAFAIGLSLAMLNVNIFYPGRRDWRRRCSAFGRGNCPWATGWAARSASGWKSWAASF